MELFLGGFISAFALIAFGAFVLIALMTRADLGKELRIEADPRIEATSANLDEWKRAALSVIGGATAILSETERTTFIRYVQEIADGHKVGA